MEAFAQTIQEGYSPKGEAITLGAGMHNQRCFSEALVKIPLKTLNRHGLIAGATGTGKTKTLQGLAGSLSENGIPVLLMDVKGDLSGIAKPGNALPFIHERHEKIGLPFVPERYPVEFLSLSGEKGTRLKATVSEFGPILISKILDLNSTQSGVMAVLFKVCDDEKLPLLDLKDLKKALEYIQSDEVEKIYGSISSATVGTILRKILEVEQQGADRFFGERSFDVQDLLRFDDHGYGTISLIRLTDIQDKPKLFSTFMLSLLAEVYATFPEIGDAGKPKLVIFIDEAHVIFDQASNALLEQLEAIIKLIRSKGVGIFFCTQSPTDIPQAILGQLGLKVQHALRAFTAKDRKAIKLASENFPLTDFYETDKVLTEMGIGEALVTALNEKGVPTPLVHTLLLAPRSHMGVLSESEIDAIIGQSRIASRYNEEIDSKSAYEILEEKLQAAKEEPKKAEKGFSIYDVMNSTLARQIARTVTREVSRALLGVLGIRRRR